MESKTYKFIDIFDDNADGSLTPKKRINVNGVIFGPGGVSFQKGVAFGGIDFHLYKYWDIRVEEENGVLIIKGFVNNI